MLRPVPLYIVASPNQKVGKTLIARLLIEFLQTAGRRVVGYDVQSRQAASLAERFPGLVERADITETRGQMRIFDQLLIDRTTSKVIDLSSNSFEQFFSVVEQIDFISESRQIGIEPIIILFADAEEGNIQMHAKLTSRFRSATVVTVYNEIVLQHFARNVFHFDALKYRQIHVPRLSNLVSKIMDRDTFSFADYLDERDTTSEIHRWATPIFTRFREIELQVFAKHLAYFYSQ
jgi:hypothetical protein